MKKVSESVYKVCRNERDWGKNVKSLSLNLIFLSRKLKVMWINDSVLLFHQNSREYTDYEDLVISSNIFGFYSEG